MGTLSSDPVNEDVPFNSILLVDGKFNCTRSDLALLLLRFVCSVKDTAFLISMKICDSCVSFPVASLTTGRKMGDVRYQDMEGMSYH